MNNNHYSKIFVVFKLRNSSFRISIKKVVHFLAYLIPVLFFGHIYLERYMKYSFPLGWDTAYYLYIARLLEQIGIEETFYHPRVLGTYIIPSFLISLLNIFTQDAFLSVKILQLVSVTILLIASVKIMLSRFNGNMKKLHCLFFPALALSFLSWWTPIRLAADLLGTFTNFTLIIALLILVSHVLRANGSPIFLISLGIISGVLMGLSHVFTGIFFSFILMMDFFLLLAVTKSFKKVMMREGYFYVPFALSSLGYFFFIIKIRPGILSWLYTPPKAQPLNVTDLFDLFLFSKSMGYYLTPLSILSSILFVTFVLKSIISRESPVDKELVSPHALPYRVLLILSAFNILSCILFRVLPPPMNQFLKFSARGILMTHVPVLITFIIEKSVEICRHEKKARIILITSMIVFLVTSSFLALPYQYKEVSIHLKPFIYNSDFMSELSLLRNELEEKYQAGEHIPLIIIYVGNDSKPYQDFSELIDNWIGAFIGEHLTFFGTLDEFVLLQSSLSGKFWFIDYQNTRTINSLTKDNLCERGIYAFVLTSIYQYHELESLDYQLKGRCKMRLKVISSVEDGKW